MCVSFLSFFCIRLDSNRSSLFNRCSSYNCDSTGTCATPADTVRTPAIWVYVIVGLGIAIRTLTLVPCSACCELTRCVMASVIFGTLGTLFIIHRRSREEYQVRLEQYYTEQVGPTRVHFLTSQPPLTPALLRPCRSPTASHSSISARPATRFSRFLETHTSTLLVRAFLSPVRRARALPRARSSTASRGRHLPLLRLFLRSQSVPPSCCAFPSHTFPLPGACFDSFSFSSMCLARRLFTTASLAFPWSNTLTLPSHSLRLLFTLMHGPFLGQQPVGARYVQSMPPAAP